jgi:hypothetical protein
LAYKGDARLISKCIEDGLEESPSVHRRPQIAHIEREGPIKVVQRFGASELDYQSRAFGLPDLIANFGIELTPEVPRITWKRQE